MRPRRDRDVRFFVRDETDTFQNSVSIPSRDRDFETGTSCLVSNRYEKLQLPRQSPQTPKRAPLSGTSEDCRAADTLTSTVLNFLDTPPTTERTLCGAEAFVVRYGVVVRSIGESSSRCAGYVILPVLVGRTTPQRAMPSGPPANSAWPIIGLRLTVARLLWAYAVVLRDTVVFTGTSAAFCDVVDSPAV